jgi:hypothetical protein
VGKDEQRKTSERKSRDRWLGAIGERETLVEMGGRGGRSGFWGDVGVTGGDVKSIKIPLF